MDVLEFLATIASGIGIGVALEMVRNHYGQRIERIKRLSPFIERAYPIIEELCQDCAYTLKIQNRGNQKEIDDMLNKLAKGLRLYHDWYREYRENGLGPELGSINNNLQACLDGLFRFSQMNITYGNGYVHERLHVFSNRLLMSQEGIGGFLRG